MNSGKDDVSTLRRQGQVVLDKHLDFTKAGLGEVNCKRREAFPPRSLFRWRRAVASLIEHLLQKLLDEGLGFLVPNAVCGCSDERQVQSQGSTKRVVRVGTCPVAGSSSRKSVEPRQ
jgi:hypothetical protein